MKRALALVVASLLVLGMALAQDVQPVVKSGAKSINEVYPIGWTAFSHFLGGKFWYGLSCS